MSATGTVVVSIVFYVAAVSAILGGVGVISARSPIYSALSLILTLAQLAVMYLLLNAQFIAAAQILIYAGAVMVLFLFVITLLGVSKYPLVGEHLPLQRVFSVTVAFLLLIGVIFFVAQGPDAITGFHLGFNQLQQVDNVAAFGTELFTVFVFPFELTSLLLIVAMVGAVAVGRRRSREFDSILGRIERPEPIPTPPSQALEGVESETTPVPETTEV